MVRQVRSRSFRQELHQQPSNASPSSQVLDESSTQPLPVLCPSHFQSPLLAFPDRIRWLGDSGLFLHHGSCLSSCDVSLVERVLGFLMPYGQGQG